MSDNTLQYDPATLPHVGFSNIPAPESGHDPAMWMLDAANVHKLCAELSQILYNLTLRQENVNVIVVLGGEDGYKFVFHDVSNDTEGQK